MNTQDYKNAAKKLKDFRVEMAMQEVRIAVKRCKKFNMSLRKLAGVWNITAAKLSKIQSINN